MEAQKSSLIIEEEKSIVENNLAEKISTSIPIDYITVKFESMGSLQECPKELHIRDYTLNDALQLNVQDEEEQVKALINVINSMIYEKYDVKNLHPNDFMMLLYSIHNKFISAKIDKEYILDETLPEGEEEGERYHSKNIRPIEIPLSKLMIHNIHEDVKGNKRPDSKTFGGKFKEPIKIANVDTGALYGFRFSRMEDYLLAQEFCKEKFSDSLRDFLPIKRMLYKLTSSKKNIDERNKELDALIDSDPDTYENYQKFLIQNNLEYAKIIQACLIDGYMNEKKEYVKYTSLDEKIEAYNKKITIKMWEQFNEVSKEYPFGIMEEYTFFCDEYQRNITRRFQFQFLDFIPSSDQEHSGRFNVLFD
jgi:hypothetical protein